MSVENVERAILDTVQTTADFPWWLGQHRNAARCALVDPVLWALGWNTALPSQCRPHFPLAGGRKADYALLDRDGRLAAGLLIGRSLSRRDSDRARLRDTVRGIKGGVAVLACVLHWGLYDLSRRVRPFDNKRAAELLLRADAAEATREAADALHWWLGREHWW